MNLFCRVGLSLAALGLALPAVADDAAKKPALGAETRAWLTLQQSGQQASGAPRPMPGEMADSVYQRYLDSFKQPIPAEFKRQSASETGNANGK